MRTSPHPPSLTDPAIVAGAAIALALICAALVVPAAALAHGVSLSYEPREGVEVVARFEGGSPMAGAQVAVFAPGEPAEPVETGVTDDEGRYFFTPDAERPGTWEVRIRDAGHGGLLRVQVEDDGVSGQADAGFSGLQKAAMAAAVSWGFVGTALYFRRKPE